MIPSDSINAKRLGGRTCFKAAVKENIINMGVPLDMSNAAVLNSAMSQRKSLQTYDGKIVLHMTFKSMNMHGVMYGANLYGDAFQAQQDGSVRLHYVGNITENGLKRYDEVKDPNNQKPIYLATRKKDDHSFRFIGELRLVSHIEVPDGSTVITLKLLNVDRAVFDANPSWFE